MKKCLLMFSLSITALLLAVLSRDQPSGDFEQDFVAGERLKNSAVEEGWQDLANDERLTENQHLRKVARDTIK